MILAYSSYSSGVESLQSCQLSEAKRYRKLWRLNSPLSMVNTIPGRIEVKCSRLTIQNVSLSPLHAFFLSQFETYFSSVVVQLHKRDDLRCLLFASSKVHTSNHHGVSSLRKKREQQLIKEDFLLTPSPYN